MEIFCMTQGTQTGVLRQSKKNSHCHNETVASCTLQLEKLPLLIKTREESSQSQFEKNILLHLERSKATTTRRSLLQKLESSLQTTAREELTHHK